MQIDFFQHVAEVAPFDSLGQGQTFAVQENSGCFGAVFLTVREAGTDNYSVIRLSDGLMYPSSNFARQKVYKLNATLNVRFQRAEDGEKK